MSRRPQDVTDLYLAPVALELDWRLEELSGLSPDELDARITLATDREPRDADERSALALDTLTHLMDLHGWQVRWDPRGLRLSNDDHELVLGVPQNVRSHLGL